MEEGTSGKAGVGILASLEMGNLSFQEGAVLRNCLPFTASFYSLDKERICLRDKALNFSLEHQQDNLFLSFPFCAVGI